MRVWRLKKNHFDSCSEYGTDVDVLFHSLLGSENLACVEPKLHSRPATRAALANCQAVTLPKDLRR